MYMPDKSMDREKFPDREWFWGVLSTVLPDWAEAYRKAVVDQRRDKKPQLPIENRVIKISDKWLSKLQEHDHQTKSKYWRLNISQP